MKLFGWLRGRLSFRDTAMSLYRRGMSNAKLHDNASALADYTAVIEMADAPEEVRAMALYNRAVAHTALHNCSQAISDLEKLLEMPRAAPNVKIEARRKLVRMHRASDRLEVRPSTQVS